MLRKAGSWQAGDPYGAKRPEGTNKNSAMTPPIQYNEIDV